MKLHKAIDTQYIIEEKKVLLWTQAYSCRLHCVITLLVLKYVIILYNYNDFIIRMTLNKATEFFMVVFT